MKSKEPNKQTSRTEADSCIQRTFWWLSDEKAVGRMGEEGEEI